VFVNVQVTVSPGSSQKLAVREARSPLLGCALEASSQLIDVRSKLGVGSASVEL
jgi:hypothetical protein